ncbi:hypothetical protein ME9_01089 [Bartonella taylorii 8TBB]|uniref:Uncharacterized protein n=1 Tax=Bartonella taylorii 8TBB TaxID=1094560 RepID=A0A9P2W2G7_BARTA|nr:hypothetical protein ME9_01089 [Bartonella taylorii 8TBB]
MLDYVNKLSISAIFITGSKIFPLIKIKYFLNDMARFKAFKRSMIDVFIETNLNRLQHSYNFPAVPDRYIIKESFSKETFARLELMGVIF